ncbi:hypothetical protein HYX58_02455 [Candidatus Dependentiae bacterium]|nr:hypothetical protein [Candidatus Dependentiae bacterium]
MISSQIILLTVLMYVFAISGMEKRPQIFNSFTNKAFTNPIIYQKYAGTGFSLLEKKDTKPESIKLSKRISALPIPLQQAILSQIPVENRFPIDSSTSLSVEKSTILFVAKDTAPSQNNFYEIDKTLYDSFAVGTLPPKKQDHAVWKSLDGDKLTIVVSDQKTGQLSLLKRASLDALWHIDEEFEKPSTYTGTTHSRLRNYFLKNDRFLIMCSGQSKVTMYNLKDNTAMEMCYFLSNANDHKSNANLPHLSGISLPSENAPHLFPMVTNDGVTPYIMRIYNTQDRSFSYNHYLPRNTEISALVLNTQPLLLKDLPYSTKDRIDKCTELAKYLEKEPNAAQLVGNAIEFLVFRWKGSKDGEAILAKLSDSNYIHNKYRLIAFTQHGQDGNIFKSVYEKTKACKDQERTFFSGFYEIAQLFLQNMYLKK